MTPPELWWPAVGILTVRAYVARLLELPINVDTIAAREELIPSPLSVRDVLERQEKRERRRRRWTVAA